MMDELIESVLVADTVSRDVEEKDVPDIMEELIPKMKSVLDELRGAGLTAIQIGVPKKVSIYYWNGLNTIFNGNYYKGSSSRYKVYEGCLSYNYGETAFPVKRYKEIIAVYDIWDTDKGMLLRKRRKVKGVEAQILQHEIDHQHGKTIY